MVVGRESPQILGPVGAVHLVGGAVVGVEAVALATDAGTALIAPTHLERMFKVTTFFLYKKYMPALLLHILQWHTRGHWDKCTSVPCQDSAPL